MTPVKDLPPYLANFKTFFAKKENMGLKAMKRIEGKPTGVFSEKRTIPTHIHTHIQRSRFFGFTLNVPDNTFNSFALEFTYARRLKILACGVSLEVGSFEVVKKRAGGSVAIV